MSPPEDPDARPPLSARIRGKLCRWKHKALYRGRAPASERERFRLYDHPGGKIYIDPYESALMHYRLAGIYEYWKTTLFKKVVKPGMNVADIGGNKGDFTLLAARLMGDEGRVLSFEPEPVNHRWLKKSIGANGYESVRLYRLALSDEVGEATFFPGKLSGQGSLFDGRKGRDSGSECFKVKTTTLDRLMKREGLSSLDVMKIDVQGADLHVLRGAKKTLERSPRLQVLMDLDVEEEDERRQVLDILGSCGMRIYSVGRTMKRVRDPGDVTFDLYAVRKGVELPFGKDGRIG